MSLRLNRLYSLIEMLFLKLLLCRAILVGRLLGIAFNGFRRVIL